MNLKKIQKIAGTYLALAIPAVIATFMSGHTDPATLLVVAAASILAPIVRGMNPKDQAFGIVSSVNTAVQAKAEKVTAPKK